MQFMTKKRTFLLLVALVISFSLFYNASQNIPPTIEESVNNTSRQSHPAARLPACTSRQTFGNLSDTHYFVFVKPKFGDSEPFSNLFFYLGLKYSKYFAINIEQPPTWLGLAEGLRDDTYLQSTEQKPRILCQEFSYYPPAVDTLFEAYQVSSKIVVGYLRDPQEIFMSCLLKHVQYQRKLKKEGISIMLNQNVEDYLDLFEGNTKQSSAYIKYSACNNLLSYTLGLSDYDYKEVYKFGDERLQGPDKFADLVEKRVTDFIIYERMEASVFLLQEKYCLAKGEDFMFLRKVKETFVGIGFGSLSAQTRERLDLFLKFDYALYNGVLRKHDRQFAGNMHNSAFAADYRNYRNSLHKFTSHCCYDTLSMVPEESMERSYMLTPRGENNIQCRFIHGSNALLANVVYQIQEFNLTGTVGGMVGREEGYKQFWELIEETLEEEEDT